MTWVDPRVARDVCRTHDPTDLPCDVHPGPVVWHTPADGRNSVGEGPLPGEGARIDSRKTFPLATGCLDYFPDALLAVAELSYWGNEKHNPGEPLHDARRKSGDDADALLRHLKDRGTWDEITLADGRKVRVRHSVAVAWRALRLAQREIEADTGTIARGARL